MTEPAPRRSVARLIPSFVLAVLAGASGLACQGGRASPAGASGDGGGAGQGGAGAPGGDGATLDAADGATVAACLESPAPLRKVGALLSLSLSPVLEGRPFVFGEPNALASGAKVTALNFRFYVAHVALLTASGASIPVDLVTSTGAVEPYDIHLFNAEDPSSQTLRVLAPPGSYTGLTFMLGLDDACNSGFPSEREPPLTDTSQMTWPHLSGYLFLRLEDQLDTIGGNGDAGSADAGPGVAAGGDAGAAQIPPAVHMGGAPGRLFAPTITVTGPLALAAGASVSKTLSVDVGAIFAGAEADVDPASLALVLPFPEVLAGERLRQHAPALALFVLAP